MEIKRKKVTIHQPDFMPWTGLFNKISKVDEFIILDHVDNNPRDSNFWGRRVKFLINGNASWLGVPLVKEEGRLGVPICEMRLSLVDKKACEKNINALYNSYKKTSFFADCFYLIESYFTHSSEMLSVRNSWFIEEVLKRLNIDVKVNYSSSMHCTGKATELLVALIKKSEGSAYICGMGASGYQDDALLNENGIEIIYNQYSPKAYSQFGVCDFVPGLSIVDVLMNLGFNETEVRLKNQTI